MELRFYTENTDILKNFQEYSQEQFLRIRLKIILCSVSHKTISFLMMKIHLIHPTRIKRH